MRFKESEVVNVRAMLQRRSGQMKRFYSKKSCKKDFELEVLRRKPGCVPDSCLLALMYDEARLGCTCLALLEPQADIFLAS